MGLIYAEIELINTSDLIMHEHGYLPSDQIKRLQASALVDSGAYMLTLPPDLARLLGLPKMHNQMTELADGSLVDLEVMGPVDVRFENRSTVCRALVLPGCTEILLGSIPMEDMDVVIDYKQQKMTVNPASPYIARTVLKTLYQPK
jgi:clan AA aspartic protease